MTIKAIKVSSVSLVLLAAASCTPELSPTLTTAQRDSVRVVTPDQVAFIPLNPARGKDSPQAGVLWGDIRSDEASGVLLRFADGFSSPPHIHNITYRAVVISGEIHNDDPGAAKQWMGPGSFWIQPAGEVHITAARPGAEATAFLEILTGPYLVQPSADEFVSDQRPLNLEHSNLSWMGVDQFEWLRAATTAEGEPQVALLWGELNTGAPSGSLLKLPRGYTGQLSSVGGRLRSVVIQGTIAHAVSAVTDERLIEAGGYFQSSARVPHAITCQQNDDCLLYLRSEGPFEVR